MTTHERQSFNQSEIRDAERALEVALESDDRTAWVYAYTEDAVFDAGGDHAIEGREALLDMAESMRRLSDVSIRPLRTEVSGDLAIVWFEASWLSGAAPDTRGVEVRGIIAWRRDGDGRWRVALEHIG